MIGFTRNITAVLSKSCRRYSSSCEEIQIPVPWGHIAAKWWGPKDKQPILTSHGWQDNCGSFDRLIPLLPQSISFLTYDFPGHGKSSQLPPGIFYHGTDGAVLIKRILDYFKWTKVSLMGHSLGSGVNFIYSMVFPETVNFIICLDLLKPILPENRLDRQRKAIEEFLKYDGLNSLNTEPPSFSIQEMEEKLHIGSRKQIDLEYCKYILNRNVLPSQVGDGKVYLSRDPRLKTGILIHWSQSAILENLHHLKCPIFLYMASGTPRYEPRELHLEAIQALQKLNKLFEVHFVNGSHHVHLNEPEKVSGLISTFLNKYV